MVVFLDEAQAAPTSEEAQERGAVAALARVAGHRNMQRVLPPLFQAAWTWCVQQVGVVNAAVCDQSDRHDLSASGLPLC